MICHSKTPCLGVNSLTSAASYDSGGCFNLSYLLIGNLQTIIIPPIKETSSIDGLWEHTCFEAFICVQGEKIYNEYNFSPSTQWAAYAFSDYRKHKEWAMNQAPVIYVEKSDNQLKLDVILGANDLPENPNKKALQLGLTAVVESADGSKSYWALKHPADVPDFHNKKGFIREIWP